MTGDIGTIDIHQLLVVELNKILPTYYYNIQDTDLKMPCITYALLEEYDLQTGSTINYSYISFRVTVWAENLKDLNENTNKVRSTLRTAGFKLTGSTELAANGLIQRVMTVTGIKYRVPRNIAKAIHGGE